MVTYEDITEMFLNAAEETGLSVHPEYWMNTQTLEREFACTLHPGPCEEADQHATCTISFAWGPLDSVLSMEGAEGVCDFFHEPDEECSHLHTENVPPLVLDLAYHLPLEGVQLDVMTLQVLARTLKLRASEHSSRAVETRSQIALGLGDGAMEAEALALQQRVELPLWDPEGVSGFHSGSDRRDLLPEGHQPARRLRHRSGDEYAEEPHPEEWLPHLCAEVADDISHVIDALESSRYFGRIPNAPETNSEN